MAAESVCLRRAVASCYAFAPEWRSFKQRSCNESQAQRLLRTIRASHSADGKDRVFKQLGLFSLKKKIEDAILRAELLAPTALELEEARWIKQEQMMRDYNLWDDPAKSNEILAKLADSARVVSALKDLKYKAEEAKLISQLAEMKAIDYGLFEQAYAVSLDVGKLLHQYEMSKLLRGPFDMEGACVIIRAGEEGVCHEAWAEQLFSMYIRWAERQGHKRRVVDKCPTNDGIKSVTIEFEFKYAYGYLLGERGVHHMINSSNGSVLPEATTAAVDIIPMFLESTLDLQIDDKDLAFSSPLSHGEGHGHSNSVIHIQHIPTGTSVQSSGERSSFANRSKALNRLSAKLLVIAKEQGVSSTDSIRRDAIIDVWQIESRRYISNPNKLVQDVKTGIQLPDLNSVLDGNIEPLIGAHINSRQSGGLV